MRKVKMFCVYLTTYHGSLLPPFYVGSTSKTRIDKGYCGSVASKKFLDVWKAEVKNNRHLFNVQILSEHQTRKEAFEAELAEQLKRDVVRSDLYVNRSLARASNRFSGIDQSGSKNPMFGRSLSKEARAKISAKLTGRPKSEKTRANMSKAQRALPPRSEIARANMLAARPRGKQHAFFGKKRPELAKKLAEHKIGLFWWTDGVNVIQARQSPGDLWVRGCGEFWWNNGTVQTKSKTSPGTGWVRGRLKKEAK